MPQAAATGRIELWYSHLIQAMLRYGITSDKRIAYFLANVAEETGQLQAREENLRYSGDRLIAVFPSLFGHAQEKAYSLAQQGPEAIANYIYSDAVRPPGYRMGNNMPGDGWKYRGRGPMQLTGKANYQQFFKNVNLPASSDPDLLLQPEYGALSAAEFWSRAGCNATADAGDFYSTVVKVNGGTIGMPTRQAYLKRFQEAMSHPDPAVQSQGLLSRPEPAQEVIGPAPAEFSKANILPPELDPVMPMSPVPPAGYDVTKAGNVVRQDVSESGIYKAAKTGQKLSWGMGILTGVATGFQMLRDSVVGMLDGVDASILLLCLTGLAVVGAIGCWIYFGRVARKRVEMHDRGIA